MSDVSRRDFLGSIAIALPVSLLGSGASAREECWVDDWNRQMCRANIRAGDFVHYQGQEGYFWCWAATLSMIFGWHGRHVSQRSIVEQTFGASFDVALNPFLLMRAVRRDYLSDRGSRFRVSSRVYSADAGRMDINNCDIIRELSRERPLVVCNHTHMMVLIGVDYLRDMPCTAMNIANAWVADPHPLAPYARDMGPGFRDLTQGELVPAPLGGQLRFLSTIDVS
jgi:hypothetical protein